MPPITQITGPEFTALIAAHAPVLVWFDGTPDTLGYAIPSFAVTMQRYAARIQGVRIVLLDVDQWESHAAEAGVDGAPELILYRGGQAIAHHVGAMEIGELAMWVR